MPSKAGHFSVEINTQTINRSAGLPLQIVPTLTATADGRPGTDSLVTLVGSGFIEGASTIKVGGIDIVDDRTDASTYYSTEGIGPEVFDQKNGQYRFALPLGLEGPIRITTAGGHAEIPSATLPAALPVQFSGILAISSVSGAPADAGLPAANAGSTITLAGNGFSSSTLVQFEAVDATGAVGTITRQGTMTANGSRLAVQVPAQARTGQVRVLGATESHALQVVPWPRGVGGTIATGNTLVIDGSGFVPGQVAVTVDGIPATIQGLALVADGASGSIDATTAALSTQQLLRVTVPAGIGEGVVSVATAGGQANSRRTAVTTLADIVPGSRCCRSCRRSRPTTSPARSTSTAPASSKGA